MKINYIIHNFFLLYYNKYLLILFFIYSLVNIRPLKNIPKISVYMPIYNKSKYLMRSINSIQNQTLRDIEINFCL